MGRERSTVVAMMADAVRARTALAASGWLTWTVADHTVEAPYVDHGGAPLVLVDEDTAEQLLAVGHAETELRAIPELGTVRLSGALWPVVGGDYLRAVERFRVEHADCADCWRPERSRLIGLRLDEITLAEPEGGPVRTIATGPYAEAVPDPVIAHSIPVRGHINTAHADDVMELAAWLVGASADQLVAASLDWIDCWGVELVVIDADGSQVCRLPFRQPLTTIADLTGQLHDLLGRAGGGY